MDLSVITGRKNWQYFREEAFRGFSTGDITSGQPPFFDYKGGLEKISHFNFVL